MARLALLGGGKMGEALIGGLTSSGWAPADITVAEVFDARRAELVERFPGLAVVPDGASAVAGAETVVVAVKPDDVADALGAAAPALGPAALVLSIAAGVRIAELERLAPGNPVVRVMPNTPALVGKGAAAIAPGSHATDSHLDRAEDILGAVGIVVRLPEELLDAVTGLSGSGPAYVFYLAEALMEAGRAQGLPPAVADKLVVQTLLGAATLLAESGERPENLRAAVTSKGGTTERAVALLDDRGFGAALVDAVAAATERSKEMGAG
ncbi:MAG: pyrroline-5-carboxylate reductase [Actinobacteria bacterium]|nr:pyrroline-5-carboxylate reductase [Actinomycetota bacterium]